MTFGPPTLIASDVDGTLIDDEQAALARTAVPSMHTASTRREGRLVMTGSRD